MPSIPIFKMFGRSPIRPLQHQMKCVYECAQLLHPFFNEVLAGNWKKAAEYHKQIIKLENEADDLKSDLRLNLPKGLFIPVQRSDVLELVGRQDRLANIAKDIAGIVIGRKMVFPKEIQEDYMTLLECNINAAHQAYKAISELDKVFEGGFSGKELGIIEAMVRTLQKLERDADKMQIKLRRIIFGLESSLPPVNVVFTYKVIEWTGDLANCAQHVGVGVQILIAR